MLRSVLSVVAAAISLSPCLLAQPDLAIRDLSISSTLPLAGGQRLVTVSFRIQNIGSADASASQTRVSITGSGASTYATPALRGEQIIGPGKGGESAFASHSVRTTSVAATISVQADAGQTVSEFNEQNNVFQSFVRFARVENNRWQSIGPSTRPPGAPVLGVGRVTTLAIDPLNPDVVYAGARGSGLWKTADAGKSWFPLTDALPGVAGAEKTSRATAVLIDPNDRNRVLLASSSGVFESRNGGAVWIRLATGLPEPTNAGFLLKRNAISGEILYLSTSQGVRVSQDGGRTWTTVLGDRDKNPVNSLQLSTSGTSLFASLSAPPGGSDAVGIYVGTGDGLSPQSWRKLPLCPVPKMPVIPRNAQVWVAQSGPELWMSFRGEREGKPFAELWKATSQTCVVNKNPERLWAKVSLDEDCSTFAQNFSFLFLHPTVSSIVFKAGVPLCRSGSGGTPRPVPHLHFDHHAIAVAPSNPAVMYLGGDGGIYRSDDFGASWRFVGEGLAVTEFLNLSFGGVPGRILLGGTQDGGSYAWDGTTPVWKSADDGVRDVSAIAFDRSDSAAFFEIGSGTRKDVFRYRDDPSDPRSLSTSALPDCPMYSEAPRLSGQVVSTGECFPSATSFACPLTSRSLVIACDGLWVGPVWRQINLPAGNTFHRIKHGPGGLFLAGTTDGRVFGSSDLGSLKLLFQTPSKITALAVATSRTFFVATASPGPGRIFRLNCLGTDQNLACKGRDLSPPLEFPGEILAIAVDPLEPDALLAALRENGVIRGANDSAGNFTWTAYNNGLPVGVTATDIETSADGRIFLGTWGRGAYVVHSGLLVGTDLRTQGRLTSFEERTVAGPFGLPIASFVTLQIDSVPDRVLTAANLDSASLTILRNAFRDQTKVTLDFVVTGGTAGRITRVRALA